MKTNITDNKKPRQQELLLPLALFIFFYAAILSIANSIRIHAAFTEVDLGFAIPFLGWLLGLLLVNQSLKTFLPNRDLWIFPIVYGLIGWGLLTIWRLSPSLGLRQLAWYIVGCLILLLGVRIKDLILTLKRYKYIWLVLGLILISLTFVVGVNPGGSGPKLWLNIFGLYIQPSEPLKLLMIVYLAAFFADQIRPNIPLASAVMPTLIVTALAGLLLVGQRDLGTASIFIILYVLMLTVTTHRRRFLWLIPLVALLAGLVGYFAFDIVRARVDIWLNPWMDVQGDSYQLAQAQISIAAGGMFGTGPGLGSPQIVPVAVSDFIFTAIAEETGLFGTVALILLILLLSIRGIIIAKASKTTFGRYLAFGISAYFALQSFLIISGNLGLLPLTGVTLPFLSYGGSSLVTNMVCVLILLRISTETSSVALPENQQRPFQLIAAIIMVVFAGIIIKNTFTSVVNQAELLARPENPRWAVYDRYSPRGNIYTQSQEPLAITTGNPGQFTREITYPQLSNTIGYAQGLYGQVGLEKSLYSVLRGYTGVDYNTTWWHELFYNQPPAGLDVRLNIDLSLQKTADSLLQGHQGSVILMNAKTGEIYVMATHPNFDANTLMKDFTGLMNRQDAPLLNRVTQGNYQLGTLANTLALSSYWDAAPTNLEEPKISPRLDLACYQAMQSAELGLNRLQFGCESTTSQLLSELTRESLSQTMQNFGLFSSPTIALDVATPAEPSTIQNASDYVAATEETQVSPLQMALVAAAITNDGIQPSPKLVNSYKTPSGEWVAFGNGGDEHAVLSQSVAVRLKESFKGGTQPIWFQNGHSRLPAGSTLTWYIGGTTSDWHGVPLAIAIALEENDPALTQKIGSQLLNLSY